MDTIEQESPVGSDGATSSPDTESTDTQPTESTDSVSDGEVEEVDEAPTLLAGKYKSPEELEKAYLEIQKTVGQVSQKAELANRLEKTTGMTAQQIEDYLTNQEYAQYQQQVQGNPGLAAYQEVQNLKGQIALQNEINLLNEALNSEEGKPYQQFRDRIQEAAFNMPSMKNKPYLDIARELFGNAIAQGQQDAYKKIEKKVMTQSSGVKSAPQKRFSIDDMRGMTSAEMEAILPHAQPR